MNHYNSQRAVIPSTFSNCFPESLSCLRLDGLEQGVKNLTSLTLHTLHLTSSELLLWITPRRQWPLSINCRSLRSLHFQNLNRNLSEVSKVSQSLCILPYLTNYLKLAHSPVGTGPVKKRIYICWNLTAERGRALITTFTQLLCFKTIPGPRSGKRFVVRYS